MEKRKNKIETQIIHDEEREKLGISDSLIRISVGIEATEDLIEDFFQALSD